LLEMTNYFRWSLIAALTFVTYYSIFDGESSFGRERRATPAGVPRACTRAGLFAFTFDEGPSKNTDSLLATLKAQNIKATFHVNVFATAGTFEASIKKAYADGHLIGLRFPPSFDARFLDKNSIVEMIVRDSQKIFDLIKVYPRFIRMSYDQYNTDTVKIIKELGMEITEWNVDPRTVNTIATNATAAQITEQLNTAITADMNKEGAGNGFIVLLHEFSEAFSKPEGFANFLTEFKKTNQLEYVSLDTCRGITGGYREKNIDTRDPSKTTTRASSSSDIPQATPAPKSEGNVLQVSFVALVSLLLVFFQ